jgi:hypothetical protein
MRAKCRIQPTVVQVATPPSVRVVYYVRREHSGDSQFNTLELLCLLR